ncbi:MAG: GNAT family N-acetyltransferase, partial [Acidimicrobiaceae bacterium]|nr:GNAT family N-acetyltransferase [Acidimicrobiaceae bacterium]
AHLRGWRRPLMASEHGYLDDLFVAPQARGTGAVDALFAGIRHVAVQRGWQVVRWTTAEDNYRAQAVYARYAARTSWVTYDESIE